MREDTDQKVYFVKKKILYLKPGEVKYFVLQTSRTIPYKVKNARVEGEEGEEPQVNKSSKTTCLWLSETAL